MNELRHTASLIVVGALLFCGPAEAGVKEGIDAVHRGDYATALRELGPAAERGDSEAQYRLGVLFEFGHGVAMDKPKAMSLLHKSAAQGNSSAQVELGVIYATGDGIAQDDAKAVDWFRKAAEQGDSTAQIDLGLMYAKGTGVDRDDAQAATWFRKAADQGLPLAQFKMGVAYENGEGVAKDGVLAYASYAIAARGGNKEYVSHRDDMARQLSPSQLHEGVLLADTWSPGQPMPARGAASKSQGAAATAAAVAEKCSATGTMDGEKFSATHCAISLFGDQHSVAIWFNEDAIAPSEAEAFQLSSYADGAKGGKQRTLVRIMFCPGGGSATASPQSVKSIDFSTNNARSMIAGVQWVVESPKDFRVEKMSGEVKPGSILSGRIVGARGKTTWNLDFDLKLPARDAAAGSSCGK